MAGQTRYGKLTADDLRLLLTFFPQLEQEMAEVDQIIADKGEKLFPPNGPQFYWCDYYEKPIKQHLAEIFVGGFGMGDELRELATSENQIATAQKIINQLHADTDDTDDEPELEPEQAAVAALYVLALTISILRNLRCLMAYGQYINDLIAEAREGKPALRENALFKAIRIDPTVVGCATAKGLISRAVMQNNHSFFRKLVKAIQGKLGAKESETYQKMRIILQVLFESGAVHLNDKQLKTLFVQELDLYSPVPGAEKNLREFAYNFMKHKSTI